MADSDAEVGPAVVDEEGTPNGGHHLWKVAKQKMVVEESPSRRNLLQMIQHAAELATPEPDPRTSQTSWLEQEIDAIEDDEAIEEHEAELDEALKRLKVAQVNSSEKTPPQAKSGETGTEMDQMITVAPDKGGIASLYPELLSRHAAVAKPQRYSYVCPRCHYKMHFATAKSTTEVVGTNCPAARLGINGCSAELFIKLREATPILSEDAKKDALQPYRKGSLSISELQALVLQQAETLKAQGEQLSRLSALIEQKAN